MLVHTAQVRGRKIAWDKREVVQHGLNADRIKFDLDAEFRCCDSYQVVLCGPSLESPKRYIPDKDMTVAVPPSLMESTGPVSTCLLGYVGGEVRVVTAQERYPLVVVESGFTGPLDPGEEQPDLWAQLMSAEAARIEAELARESAEKARADAEAKRIAAEKARETASAEAVKAANEAAAKAEQAARQAEDRVTAALAEVAEAEQARTEAEKARAAAESSRAEAEAARIAAESKRESAEAKRKADSAKAVADASAATSAANAAAGKADAAAQAATDGEASRVAAETARAKAEQARATAETGRVEAEATRAANETKRTESFNSNLVSWNSKVDAACKKATDTASKAAQDVKTATDAAIAQTQEATNAAVAKADKATASATTAANKAEAAVSKLPLPLGNTLKGEVESTMASVHDAYPAPLVTTKVMGQSNQLTTTGKNLMRLINSGTVNGVNLTANGDGSYHVKGTQTAGFTRFYTDDGIKKPLAEFGLNVGDTVYLSAAEASAKLYMAIFFWDEKGSNVYTQVATSANVTKYTIAENVTQAYVCISLDGSVGTSVDSDFHPMISLNSNKDWEPYTGGKPSPSPDYPQEITNLNKAEVITSGINICPDDKLLCGIGYTSGVPFNKWGMVAEFPYTQPSETRGIGAVLNTKKGVTYSIAYLGSAATAAVGIAEYSGLKDVGDIAKAVSYEKVNSLKKVSLTATVDGVMVFVLASQWKDGKTNLNTFNKEDVIISIGEPCSTYTSHQSKSTPIDLQGNELLSIPNGVRDEVVIDAEGNVSLIKRVAKYVVPENVYVQDEPDNFGVQLELNAVDGNYLHKQLCPENAKYNSKINWMTIWKEGNSWANLQEFKQWFIGTEFYFGTKNPETIPLGKVELPALPEATSNVWNDGNIPANVYVQYLKDVNIAFADLESKLTQAVVAAAANL